MTYSMEVLYDARIERAAEILVVEQLRELHGQPSRVEMVEDALCEQFGYDILQRIADHGAAVEAWCYRMADEFKFRRN